MIPGKKITIPQNISNAAAGKTMFESFLSGETQGVFMTTKPVSNWESNRIVYAWVGKQGTITGMYRYKNGSIASVSLGSNYDAIAKTGDEYYFVEGTE